MMITFWMRLRQEPERRPLYETRPGEWQETERIKPLITVEWGQRDPYNNAAPLIKGQRARTGCVATATALIIAYFISGLK